MEGRREWKTAQPVAKLMVQGDRLAVPTGQKRRLSVRPAPYFQSNSQFLNYSQPDLITSLQIKI
ncbi:hypothetical protein CRP01_23975 [Flavilitoribacter nigricans DSM 23189 = NBRC 102662]|uniref:Uncharacterized protein n=1 Tax=Flavilitoribacter nigricans (strain ATCC 23147 / DSM 23189 / NBRC 102662 / NCIMB 1420 / SS-2) TaxID=1122177 RepID=A0A2D0N5Y0_FLAN2|nr:hypothetical protein CRP01_23975 [Flavilitoribacter nigricans DSM 23189 = NBRC 102662]